MLKGIKMLSKLSKPPKVSALSILIFFPYVRGFRKGKKRKALKMLNVTELGAPTRCLALADRVRLAFCTTLVLPSHYHGSPNRNSLHSFPIPAHYLDAVPSRRREPPDSRARKSAHANRL